MNMYMNKDDMVSICNNFVVMTKGWVYARFVLAFVTLVYIYVYKYMYFFIYIRISPRIRFQVDLTMLRPFAYPVVCLFLL